MKTFITKNSIYFFGKVKDLKRELEQYGSQQILIKDVIRQKLN